MAFGHARNGVIAGRKDKLVHARHGKACLKGLKLNGICTMPLEGENRKGEKQHPGKQTTCKVGKVGGKGLGELGKGESRLSSGHGVSRNPPLSTSVITYKTNLNYNTNDT